MVRRRTADSAWAPFLQPVNEVLEKADFDGFCEDSCASFYDAKLGRPSLPPGMYFRIMMIGFFEGIDSERGVWPIRSRCGSFSPSGWTRGHRTM